MREDRQSVQFSHLLRHLARKWSESILSTPEPTLDCDVRSKLYLTKLVS